MNELFLFFENGPSIPNSNPLKPTCATFSSFWLLPSLNRMSNAPAIALPYCAGNALVIKSDLSRLLLLSILTGPPVLFKAPKWLGLGMFKPSSCHNIPVGEFPLTTISLRESLPPITPAKFAAMREGSPNAPAYRLVSSILKDRALTIAKSLLVAVLSSFVLAVITTSFSCATLSTSDRFKMTSLPAVTTMLGMVCSS